MERPHAGELEPRGGGLPRGTTLSRGEFDSLTEPEKTVYPRRELISLEAWGSERVRD